MSDSDKVIGIGLGLLAGAAIGLSIGILFAPRSGSETRAMVKDKAEEIMEEAKAKAEKIIGDAKKRAAEIGKKD